MVYRLSIEFLIELMVYLDLNLEPKIQNFILFSYLIDYFRVFYVVVYLLFVYLVLLSVISRRKVGSHQLESFNYCADKGLIQDLKNFVDASPTEVKFGQFITLFQSSLLKLNDVFLVHIEQGDFTFRVWQFCNYSHFYILILRQFP